MLASNRLSIFVGSCGANRTCFSFLICGLCHAAFACGQRDLYPFQAVGVHLIAFSIPVMQLLLVHFCSTSSNEPMNP